MSDVMSITTREKVTDLHFLNRGRPGLVLAYSRERGGESDIPATKPWNKGSRPGLTLTCRRERGGECDRPALPKTWNEGSRPGLALACCCERGGDSGRSACPS